MPLEWFSRLLKATPKQRKNWRLIGGGIGIHWEAVDEDISARSLLLINQRRLTIIAPPMAKIGLISCVKSKLSTQAAARDLYTSDLFKKTRRYVSQRCDCWFILSARYGLLSPNDRIGPYELTLKTMRKDDRRKWTDKVLLQLDGHLSVGDQITILAGDRYREFLQPDLEAKGYLVEVPLLGMRFGEQLQWLKMHA